MVFFFNAVCLMLNADRNTRENEKEVNEGSGKVKNCLDSGRLIRSCCSLGFRNDSLCNNHTCNEKKNENSNNVKVSPIDSMGGPLAAA